MMKITNPYAKQGVWLRGSFHNHTTNSDGHHPLWTVYCMYSIRVADDQIIYDLRSSPLYDKMYKYVTLIGKDGRILHEETGRLKQVKYTASIYRITKKDVHVV